ncbi:5-methylthioadenosine/S-adenosylhomocysteine deaminase [Clostridia bacterium]|nr:5-methylthioadenosine/S-adenosylhomocysteine deaminase [Clostridia bacterium]
MKIRFYDAKILTKDFDIINGELHISGDKISSIGNAPAQPEHKTVFDREIDCGGNLLMPGFKNAHAHSAMTFLRSFADDMPLSDWLNTAVFPMEAKLKPDDVYLFAKLAFLEYIGNGITSCLDMYYEPESYFRAAAEYGFRLVMQGAVNNFKESAEKIAEYYELYNGRNPLVTYKLGFHAEYTTDIKIMREIAALSGKYKAPVYVHAAETAGETDGCLARYNKTPIGLFYDEGLLNYGGALFHCVYANDADMELMREKNVTAVINPASNLKLASGTPPVERFQEAGVRLALGTDGPASNNSLNLFKEMYLAATLPKFTGNNAAAVPAESVLRMATEGGAFAMGLADCDVLAPGKQADIVEIDLNKPNFQPEHNIIKNLVYSGSAANVKRTVIAGKILYENGEFHVGESPADLYAAVRNAVSELIRR